MVLFPLIALRHILTSKAFLLVYISSWIKCFHPDIFATALLNSMPMGFYQPAQIINDAVKHGVEVRPVDINFSSWDNVLEEIEADRYSQAGQMVSVDKSGLAGSNGKMTLRLTGAVTPDGVRYPLSAVITANQTATVVHETKDGQSLKGRTTSSTVKSGIVRTGL